MSVRCGSYSCIRVVLKLLTIMDGEHDFAIWCTLD